MSQPPNVLGSPDPAHDVSYEEARDQFDLESSQWDDNVLQEDVAQALRRQERERDQIGMFAATPGPFDFMSPGGAPPPGTPNWGSPVPMSAHTPAAVFSDAESDVSGFGLASLFDEAASESDELSNDDNVITYDEYLQSFFPKMSTALHVPQAGSIAGGRSTGSLPMRGKLVGGGGGSPVRKAVRTFGKKKVPIGRFVHGVDAGPQPVAMNQEFFDGRQAFWDEVEKKPFKKVVSRSKKKKDAKVVSEVREVGQIPAEVVAEQYAGDFDPTESLAAFRSGTSAEMLAGFHLVPSPAAIEAAVQMEAEAASPPDWRKKFDRFKRRWDARRPGTFREEEGPWFPAWRQRVHDGLTPDDGAYDGSISTFSGESAHLRGEREWWENAEREEEQQDAQSVVSALTAPRFAFRRKPFVRIAQFRMWGPRGYRKTRHALVASRSRARAYGGLPGNRRNPKYRFSKN